MWRPNTLFARLVIAQAVTVLLLVMLAGVLFYVERNQALARLVAERWAPALRAAATGDAAVSGVAQPLLTVERQRSLPPLSVHAAERLPRLEVLAETLRARGVAVEELAFSQARGHPQVWLGVRDAGGQRLWLGFEDELIEPRLPLRALAVLLAGLALLALASAWIARWIAGPLARLRDRVAAHDPAAPVPIPSHDAAATVEVAEIEAAWQGLSERLARQQVERQLLLAGVSHDLRSPLARIRLSAELLPAEPGVAERREAIVRNVDLADRLLGSFLDLVRADSLPMDETVDLAALARGIAAQRGHPGQPFEVLAPSALPISEANAVLLERAMLNLLDNAFQHGAAPVRLRVAAEADGAVIEVQDAGAGIPPAARERLVQAFARGDAGRSTPGTGLGLAVVAQVATRLGGRLAFDGGPGAHRVQLRLPL